MGGILVASNPVTPNLVSPLRADVCAICTATLGKDAVGHFTLQHAHSVKVYLCLDMMLMRYLQIATEEKLSTSGMWSNASATVGKDLRELTSYLGSNSLNCRSDRHGPAPDPLLSPFLCSTTFSDPTDYKTNVCYSYADSRANAESNKPSLSDAVQEQDYEERMQRAALFQELIVSIIFEARLPSEDDCFMNSRISEIEVPVLCSHLQEEHCFDFKNAVCPICAATLGKDAVGHFTMQHAHSVKRRRKFQKSGTWSNASATVGKDLPLNCRSDRHEPASDPLLSPFLCSATFSESKDYKQDVSCSYADSSAKAQRLVCSVRMIALWILGYQVAPSGARH
ncbi:hypothetical protein ACH5RR_025433 [Cinchona calisaya]|uniref:Uncharacterized protein n=1 Tax=Cinchona calisaya TaxID=153742 RepID=A0ABD2Z068_9GENT